MRRLGWRSLTIAGVLVLAAFSTTPAAQSATLGAIKVYRDHGSRVMQRIGIRCRFTPTCSRYAELAVQKYGVVRGLSKTGVRILRCNPLVEMGTVDYP